MHAQEMNRQTNTKMAAASQSTRGK